MAIVYIVILAFVNFAVLLPISMGNNGLAALALVGFVISSIALYFSPSIVASKRDHPKWTALMALNLFLGWTLIGWVAALVWALSSDPAPAAPTIYIPTPDIPNEPLYSERKASMEPAIPSSSSAYNRAGPEASKRENWGD